MTTSTSANSFNKEAYVRALEARGFDYAYALTIATIREREHRARTGKIVIKASERTAAVPMRLTGGSKSTQYLGFHLTDSATQDWRIFVQEVDSELGGHRHQGGLALFILEGKGATIIDEVRYDWEAGDLLLLPIKPGGVMHRHLNVGPRATWIAFWYDPALANLATQLIHPVGELDFADLDQDAGKPE